MIKSENPSSPYAKCFVKLKCRVLFGLFSVTVESSGFFIDRNGLPKYPYLDGRTAEAAILNRAERIYHSYFNNDQGSSVESYTGTYYTDD